MLNTARIRNSEITNLIFSPLRTLKKNSSSRNVINKHSNSIDLVIPKKIFNLKPNDKKINLKLQRLRNFIPITKLYKKKNNSFKQILKKQKYNDKKETEYFIQKLSIHKKEL